MKKIYVWGTGIILSRILNERIKLDDIAAFIDNAVGKKEYMGKKVLQPHELPGDYDAIIVANNHTREILEQCKELRFDLNKVIFLYDNIKIYDINTNYELIADVLGTNYARIVKERYHLVREISKYEMEESIDRDLYSTSMYYDDYVRVKALELIAEEIKENRVLGSVAELGVYKGEFSQCINMVFPDKKLYLLDTFAGFETNEADYEKENGSCNEVFIDSFKNVNIENVLSKMKYLKNIEIRQGVFPETMKDLDEKFAFVSLDVDFEESTVKGLEYFYPRLSEGGYIFIHDYNYGYFDCIKRAVKRYEKENALRLKKVPLCDAIGTLIVVK